MTFTHLQGEPFIQISSTHMALIIKLLPVHPLWSFEAYARKNVFSSRLGVLALPMGRLCDIEQVIIRQPFILKTD